MLSQKLLAEQLFDITEQALSNQVARNRIDLHKVLNWASQKDIDLNWLLTGSGHDPADIRVPEAGSGETLADDERAWWRGLTDELRQKCRALEKRLEAYEDPARKGAIRRDDDPADRDIILRKRAT